MKTIYLDHTATTPMRPQIIETMTVIMQETFGNPSSIHGFDRHAHGKTETARQIIVDSLQAKPHEIIFNSGGTEGDNTAILETAFSCQKGGRHLITTAIEHPAILNTMKYLETKGFDATYLLVDEKGNLSIEKIKKALREDTVLVSMMYGNNEIGNLMPIKEIGGFLTDHPAYFYTDAVQACENQTIHSEELGVDLLSISAHRIDEPKGVGFLYKRDGMDIPALLLDGEQEEEQCVGTENLAEIWGMAKVVELLSPEEREVRNSKYQGFRRLILDALEANEISYQVNGDLTNKLPHVLNLRLIGEANDLLLMGLDLNGVAISTGSVCTARDIEPSHVLETVYGEDAPVLKGSTRINFGLDDTEEDIHYFLDRLTRTVKK